MYLLWISRFPWQNEAWAKRARFAEYGHASGVNPATLWPSIDEVPQLKIEQEETHPDLLEGLEALRAKRDEEESDRQKWWVLSVDCFLDWVGWCVLYRISISGKLIGGWGLLINGCIFRWGPNRWIVYAYAPEIWFLVATLFKYFAVHFLGALRWRITVNKHGILQQVFLT